MVIFCGEVAALPDDLARACEAVGAETGDGVDGALAGADEPVGIIPVGGFAGVDGEGLARITRR